MLGRSEAPERSSSIATKENQMIHSLVRLGLLASLSLHAADPVRAVLIPTAERRPAEAIQLKDGAGNLVALQSYRGQVVLVDFWATWCGGCKQELPWFQQFATTYHRKGFSVLAVSVDEEGWPVIKPFVDPLKLSFQVVLDDTGTAKRYNLAELPAAFLIDRHGRVAAKYLGLVDRFDIESNIRALLSERRPKRKN